MIEYGKVKKISGTVPGSSPATVGAMRSGDRGYTLPRAYSARTGGIRLDYPLSDRPEGNATLLVECNRNKTYTITFEN